LDRTVRRGAQGENERAKKGSTRAFSSWFVDGPVLLCEDTALWSKGKEQANEVGAVEDYAAGIGRRRAGESIVGASSSASALRSARAAVSMAVETPAGKSVASRRRRFWNVKKDGSTPRGGRDGREEGDGEGRDGGGE